MVEQPDLSKQVRLYSCWENSGVLTPVSPTEETPLSRLICETEFCGVYLNVENQVGDTGAANSGLGRLHVYINGVEIYYLDSF